MFYSNFFGHHWFGMFLWSRHFSTFNSLWPSDAIWQHKTGSTLAQVMACCLTAVKSQAKSIHFHSRKCIWKCRLQNGGHYFVSASMCWSCVCTCRRLRVAQSWTPWYYRGWGPRPTCWDEWLSWRPTNCTPLEENKHRISSTRGNMTSYQWLNARLW